MIFLQICIVFSAWRHNKSVFKNNKTNILVFLCAFFVLKNLTSGWDAMENWWQFTPAAGAYENPVFCCRFRGTASTATKMLTNT